MSKRRKLSNSNFEEVKASEDVQKVGQVGTEADQRRSLFVRSLAKTVTGEQLAEHFSESFPIKHATVVVDPTTKVSKGYGFVTFTDAEDAQSAVEQLNNSTLDGRKIKVEVAEARHRDTEDGGKSGINVTAERLKTKREEQLHDSQPPRLIIRNLPWSVKDSDDLSKLFRSYGKIKHAVVPKKTPRMQYGFGIVIIRGKKNAERALAGVNGKEVDGRILAVDWAVDKRTWEQIQRDELELQKDVVDLETDKVAETKTLQSGDDAESVSRTVAEPDEPSKVDETSEPDDTSDLPDDEDLIASQDLETDGAPSDDEKEQKSDPNNTTIFIRNLSYEVDDDALKEHFQTFGPVRYARVVYDQESERSRGTGFVCFFNEDDAKSCVIAAPKREPLSSDKKRQGQEIVRSVLQNDAEDPSGQYTLEGRVLQVSRALNKADADRRADEASDKRLKRDGDKRRLYLLSEGTISKSSALYSRLGKAEIDIRESSAKQRQKLIKTNPNLGLSLTRLSIRNLPRYVNSKDLKALAREGIVGFAKDVKEGIRQPISKEESKRGGEEIKEAEKKRKEKGVGVVKQAKIVFEGREGGKVQEGAGRSRGYGFIEYYTHRNALAGLRWLNGHMLKPKGGAGDENGKRMTVEFAIENAQVVQRRTDREKHAVERSQKKRQDEGEGGDAKDRGRKRKRSSDAQPKAAIPERSQEIKNQTAKRNRIIAKKRTMRKARKG